MLHRRHLPVRQAGPQRRQLYAAARRAAKALGYRRLITYTLALPAGRHGSESGTSLRAAGWRVAYVAQRWHSWKGRRGRPRADKGPREAKIRWEAPL